jgi:hypothetical protein
MAMDDGARTILGVVDEGPTGSASAHWSGKLKAPGRGAANSIQVLLDAWQLAGRGEHLAKAEELIRRSIHPDDDVPGMKLLDAEAHWSYTMFLSALAKYLDVKAEAGAVDAMYAYAQASLVRYGEWMAEHERPYLDRPAELEYPTEAWAAQEFRKANVLRLAACHAEAAARKMRARGDELAERAWSDLLAFESRNMIRALAVVMIEGPRDVCLRQVAPKLPPRASHGPFPPRADFWPQKERVRARMRSVRGIVGLLLAAATPRNWRRFFAARRPPAIPRVP